MTLRAGGPASALEAPASVFARVEGPSDVLSSSSNGRFAPATDVVSRVELELLGSRSRSPFVPVMARGDDSGPGQDDLAADIRSLRLSLRVITYNVPR
jgi:hypothetical protein